MAKPTDSAREGSLEAPTRHALEWQSPAFWDKSALTKELERVFDICHGCRRCFSLCESFPTLFDAIDGSSTLELDGVPKETFWKVVDHCYLCDMCYMTKCPYVPPHAWNIDFPHLMLRAKAVRFRRSGARSRDRLLANTDRVGSLAGIPVIAQVVNAANRSAGFRKLLDKALGVHPDAPVPTYHSRTFRRRFVEGDAVVPTVAGRTRGQVAIFATCYGNRNAPEVAEDLVAIFRHNNIEVTLAPKERCCGMPKLELGDLEGVRELKEANIPVLAGLVDQGFDLVAPVPSCVLMFKQELPLMFPDDPDVARVKAAIFDPFEYLWLRHKEGALNTDFRNRLGKVSYHVACHLRVQNIGMKTRDVLRLVPGTEVEPIERCSGHDGTYAVKSEFRAASVKIARPVATRVEASQADHFTSDCPMAASQIASVAESPVEPSHPLTLLRRAYGI
jgi:Fe-S oxidoreductase